jgi:hypothetical protein
VQPMVDLPAVNAPYPALLAMRLLASLACPALLTADCLICWSRGRELNPRPTDYESVALPLSYPGFSRAYR